MIAIFQRMHRAIFGSPVAKEDSMPPPGPPRKRPTPIQRKRAARKVAKK